MSQQNDDRSSRLEDAGRKIGRKFGEAERRIQQELDEVITYLDKEVVPTVRTHSSRGLRVAADKLSKLADYMDQQKSQKP